MLHSVEIRGLRGVTQAHLALGPLTVLVGPNGGGKSTVLDALLVGASPRPGDAVGRVVRRRGGPENGAQWLFPRGDDGRVVQIAIRAAEGAWLTMLRFGSSWATEGLEETLRQWRVDGPFSTVQGEFGPCSEGALPAPDARRDIHLYSTTVFGRDNTFNFGHREADGNLLGRAVAQDWRRPWLSLVDVRASDMQPSDAQLLDAALRRGTRDSVVSDLRALVGDLKNVELLPGDVVALVRESVGAVPLAVSGDGIAAATRLALELAVPGGTVLLEEPEAFLHPRASSLVAEMICRAVERGIQVVLTSHSLEFVDHLVDAARFQRAERPKQRTPRAVLSTLSVVHTTLDSGVMSFVPFDGNAVLDLRAHLDEDLR